MRQRLVVGSSDGSAAPLKEIVNGLPSVQAVARPAASRWSTPHRRMLRVPTRSMSSATPTNGMRRRCVARVQLRAPPSAAAPPHRPRMHTLETAGPQSSIAPRLAFTGLVALAEAAHLAWEQAHGGIVSHHLLNDATLPALWNGWGLIVLPAIAWVASRRAFPAGAPRWMPRRAFLLRMGGALLAGVALSVAFAAGREHAAGALLLGIALASLAVRAYRVEYLLGFALGMAFVFGGLLPVLVGGAIALVSAAAWFGLWPLLRRAVAAVRG